MQTLNGPRQVPILMYHSISDQVQPRFRKYAVPPALFAEHLAYLHQQQYTTLTVSEYARAIASGARLPPRVVVLTFDDGLADFYSEAWPALQRYGCVATLYVPTAFVGDTSRFLWREHEADRPMLSWSQLRDLSAIGVECGAHSHRHLQLDVIPLAIARDEIVRSKKILEEKLSREVTSFAYPYGYYRSAVKQLVQDAGYSSACAVRYHMSLSRRRRVRTIAADRACGHSRRTVCATAGWPRAAAHAGVRTRARLGMAHDTSGSAYSKAGAYPRELS